ncbi:MAG: hypothetical protein ABEJ80_08920, partial [Halarchaeum sp.]
FIGAETNSDQAAPSGELILRVQQGILLYNMWLMVDFLVQVGLDKEFRSKPRITAERFRSHIQRRLTRLI